VPRLSPVSGLGHAAATCRADRERDPEVRHHRTTVPQQDVLGLDVPVDHALLVRVGERVGHLARDPHGLFDAELLLAVDPAPERLALDVRHHIVEEAVRLPRVVEREDVRVLERGRRLDLGQEALAPDHRGELRLEDLERDLALVLEVLGEVDGGHPTLAEPLLDAVAAVQGRREAFGLRGVGHAASFRSSHGAVPHTTRASVVIPAIQRSCSDVVMAITSDMAKTTIRSTFALDELTVGNLERLAAKWGLSKSETLRRIIEAAARTEEVDTSADARAALKELQERFPLSEEQADAWIREIRRMRGHDDA
jgi:hypothetical protein